MVRSEDRPTPVGIRPLYDVEETPPFLRLLPLSLQHVFAMFGATVLVPILTGLDVQAALLASGLGTILFLLVTRGQIPNYLGSSFAFIGPILTVTHAAGVGAALWGRFSPACCTWSSPGSCTARGRAGSTPSFPVLVGSIVAVIGLALSGVAVSWALTDPLQPQGGNSLAAAEVALVTVAIVLFVNLYGRGLLGVLPVLTGVVLGTGYAYLRHPDWFTAGPDGDSWARWRRPLGFSRRRSSSPATRIRWKSPAPRSRPKRGSLPSRSPPSPSSPLPNTSATSSSRNA